MEQHQLIACILFVVALFDVVLIPFISRKAVGTTKLILAMSMMSGAAITFGVGLAFWFQWIKI